MSAGKGPARALRGDREKTASFRYFILSLTRSYPIIQFVTGIWYSTLVVGVYQSNSSIHILGMKSFIRPSSVVYILFLFLGVCVGESRSKFPKNMKAEVDLEQNEIKGCGVSKPSSLPQCALKAKNPHLIHETLMYSEPLVSSGNTFQDCLQILKSMDN